MSDYTPITGEMLYEQILKVRLAKPSYGIPDPAPWSDLMFETREAYEGVAAYLAEREQMVKAEAWEEGWCQKSLQVDGYEWDWNPYRDEETE